MLVQMDGSHHPWLGDQVPPFTLLIAVDDAAGAVVDALFCEREDAHSYFLLIQGLVWDLGIPVALYTDRHGVFRHTPGSGLPGMPTQFSRAMEELGIQMIFAMSPQAKGRVERMAGTFQDRLVNLPGYSPDFNADEAIWGWVREEVTGNLCLGTKALVQARVSAFLDRLASRKDEVKRRCRTILQSRVEALLQDSHPDSKPPANAHPTLALV